MVPLSVSPFLKESLDLRQMFNIDPALIASLRPHFSEEELAQMKLYFEVSDKYNEQMNAWFQEELKDHPVFGPILAMQPPEMQKARNELSQKLTHDAIFNGEWDAYNMDLIMQGITYANMGMEFRSWYEVVSMVKDYLLPLIVKEFGTDNKKVLDALAGLGKLTDFAMQSIAESYFIEKKKIIEEQQKKQEALIKELESFAYVVSHDLKSPLRGISKISEWLLTDYEDKLDANGKQSLQLLKSRVQRLDNLIEGILKYSRLGRSENLVVDVNVSNLLKEIVDLNVSSNVKCKFPDQLPIVQFDRSKLGQIFSNLISNAIKYNDKEQPIIEILYADQATKHQFTVKDNGPGIETDYHDRIFGIFQTLHTKDEFESTGIGLSIVKKIVEDAGGTISVESEMGKGSKFIFTLPKQ